VNSLLVTIQLAAVIVLLGVIADRLGHIKDLLRDLRLSAATDRHNARVAEQSKQAVEQWTERTPVSPRVVQFPKRKRP
jgi:hypothetical protein